MKILLSLFLVGVILFFNDGRDPKYYFGAEGVVYREGYIWVGGFTPSGKFKGVEAFPTSKVESAIFTTEDLKESTEIS